MRYSHRLRRKPRWDWNRSQGTSLESAIRFGIQVGFDRIIICGCPIAKAPIIHPFQVAKDGGAWPPPKRDERDSDYVIHEFQRNLAMCLPQWKGRPIYGMSGFSRDLFGPLPEVEPVVSILCPTRERPKELRRMIDTAQETATGPVEILLYFDPDDNTVNEFLHLDGVRAFRGKKPLKLGAAWNKLCDCSTGDYVFMGNDDLVFHTQGWDRLMVHKYREEFPDGVGLLWADDMGNGARHCAFPFLSKQWVAILGYFAPTYFEFFFHDTWVFDIAKDINRAVYYPEVKIEHAHYTYRKAEFDATYKRNRNRNQNRTDEIMYKNTLNQRQYGAGVFRYYIKSRTAENMTGVGQ